jgi:predicted secreted protein
MEKARHKIKSAGLKFSNSCQIYDHKYHSKSKPFRIQMKKNQDLFHHIKVRKIINEDQNLKVRRIIIVAKNKKMP